MSLNNQKGQENNNLSQLISNSTGKKYTDKDGNISYTFNYTTADYKDNRKTKNSSDFYFENLLIKDNSKDKPSYFVIRYYPEGEWWQDSKDFRDYSGKMSFYNLKGASLGSVSFKKGKPLDQENKGCNLSV